MRYALQAYAFYNTQRKINTRKIMMMKIVLHEMMYFTARRYFYNKVVEEVEFITFAANSVVNCYQENQEEELAVTFMCTIPEKIHWYVHHVCVMYHGEVTKTPPYHTLSKKFQALRKRVGDDPFIMVDNSVVLNILETNKMKGMYADDELAKEVEHVECRYKKVLTLDLIGHYYQVFAVLGGNYVLDSFPLPKAKRDVMKILGPSPPVKKETPEEIAARARMYALEDEWIRNCGGVGAFYEYPVDRSKTFICQEDGDIEEQQEEI